MTLPVDYRSMRAELEQRRRQLEEFEQWLAHEEAGGATVVRIELARRFFGIPD